MDLMENLLDKEPIYLRHIESDWKLEEKCEKQQPRCTFSTRATSSLSSDGRIECVLTMIALGFPRKETIDYIESVSESDYKAFQKDEMRKDIREKCLRKDATSIMQKALNGDHECIPEDICLKFFGIDAFSFGQCSNVQHLQLIDRNEELVQFFNEKIEFYRKELTQTTEEKETLGVLINILENSENEINNVLFSSGAIRLVEGKRADIHI